MATQWVLDKVSDALAPTVSRTVATAGGYAGGAVSYVGTSINGVGEGFNRFVKTYGDGTLDYGNSIMDWTAAEGPRKQTASNPLGLSGGKAGGKQNVTSPNIYHAPKSTPSKAATLKNTTSTNRSARTSQPKAGAATSKASKPQSVVSKAPTGPNAGALRGAGGAKKPVQKAASTTTPKRAGASKAASDASKPKAHQTATYMSSKSASNPVGISW